MKFCTHCGCELQDESVFCTRCGAPVENKDGAAYNPEAAQQTAFNDANVPEDTKGKAITALVFGILSIALGSVPVLGIIFAIIAKKKSSEILKNYPNCPGRGLATVAKILSTIGLIYSIIETVSWVIVIIYLVLYFALVFFMVFAGLASGI